MLKTTIQEKLKGSISFDSSFISSNERSEKTPVELFKSFYTFHTKREMTEAEVEIAEEIFCEINEEVG